MNYCLHCGINKDLSIVGAVITCHQCGHTFMKAENEMAVTADIAKRKVERDPLLQEREKTHGSFHDNADTWEKLCRTGNFVALNSEQKLALSMIYLKIARIANQPNVKDHWDDIAGYAKLAAEACQA